MGRADTRPSKSTTELADIYDELAPRMERFDPVNRLLTGRFRARLFGSVHGRVLDVACGTGENFRYLPSDVDLTGIDVSRSSLAVAERRAARLGVEADLREMDAAALTFPDDCFDAVISALSTCTFPDPAAALDEMARVCRPDGRVLLLEHGRSTVGPVARFQDWRAHAHFETAGCRWNQEPVDVVDGTNLDVLGVERRLAGVLTALEVRPKRPTTD